MKPTLIQTPTFSEQTQAVFGHLKAQASPKRILWVYRNDLERQHLQQAAALAEFDSVDWVYWPAFVLQFLMALDVPVASWAWGQVSALAAELCQSPQTAPHDFCRNTLLVVSGAQAYGPEDQPLLSALSTCFEMVQATVTSVAMPQETWVADSPDLLLAALVHDHHQRSKKEPFKTHVVITESVFDLQLQLKTLGLRPTALGAPSVFEAQEVRAVAAYLRLHLNPQDTETLFEILAMPHHQFNEETALQLKAHALQPGQSLLSVASTLPIAPEEKLFLQWLADITGPIEDLPFANSAAYLERFMGHVVTASGLEAYLDHEATETAFDAWEAIRQVMYWAHEEGLKPSDFLALTAWPDLWHGVPAADVVLSGFDPNELDVHRYVWLPSPAQSLDGETVLLTAGHPLAAGAEGVVPITSDSLGPAIASGTVVLHPTWGRGTVLSVAGSGETAVYTIAFADTQRQLMAKYADLAVEP
ncbi:MAG: hypothetical protein AB7F28_07665 [Candidatus Margulisiibacteriota bacterium]